MARRALWAACSLSVLAQHRAASAAETAGGDPVLAAHLGALRSGGGGLNVVGDATVGYKTADVGVVGRGSLTRYRYGSEASAWAQNDYVGDLEGWFLTGGPGARYRAEIRASGSFRRFKTVNVLLTPQVFTTAEISKIFVGDALLGLRAVWSDSLRGDLLVGAGVQRETYREVGVSDADLSLTADRNFVAHFAARGALTWSVVPTFLTTRLLATAERFQLSRDRVTLSGGDASAVGLATEHTAVVELTVRAEALCPLAGWKGSALGIYAEFGSLSLSTDTTTVRVSQATFGLGWSRAEPTD